MESILRVQSGLASRDLVLLGWLADQGVLTTDQIAAALFPSVNFAQRRLHVVRDCLHRCTMASGWVSALPRTIREAHDRQDMPWAAPPGLPITWARPTRSEVLLV
ncbi:hypothetical protein ACTWLT_10510 [Micromonospora sp. ZYX-F-536]|uniref:hypothetical protein n=1 Tax=Micromonospora sp. ZYX-F-536 TaxID=3457629 RepID=UPI0040408EA9